MFQKIYWQTACLLQRAGSLDGKSADHNKIAKAVSLLAKQGVNIVPIDVNKSEEDFALDADKNIIYFGLSAVKGLKSKVVEKILQERPFKSMWDFIVRTNADITSIVTLIKSGGFDSFGSREDHIDAISRFKADTKERLNGQNLAMLSREGYWPQHTPELVLAQRTFNFTVYLKKHKYKINDRICAFLDELGFLHDGHEVDPNAWKAYYDMMMRPIKEYLIDNQEEMLAKVNEDIICKWKDKYFPNNDFAQWEIETMGLCFREHPMAHVINVDDFDSLPQEPEIAHIYRTQTGRNIPMYRLTMICGIVVAKDKLHSTITLLTATGPVDVKFRKEQFAHYDAQISRQVGGKKQIIERSWLNRGVGLIVHGMRQDDLFIAKTYKNSPMSHTAYKVTNILSTGKIEVQKDRKKGRQEESDGEE